MITISTAIAISRNVYQSAAATSFKGMLFNLVHFRPIDWHDDYMPISDWIAYALGVSVIIVVIAYLRDQKNKNQIIFRPLIAGLIAAALLGVAQGLTGIGLPDNLLSFRKDFLGYAVIGFQPDLHAYAGHMLLGAIGLWGYFYSDLSKLERKFILFAVTLSWVGLILSKSRALLLIAVAVALIWLVWYLWKNKRHLLLPTVASLVGVISIFIVLIFNYSNHLSGIPVLSWLGELANEFKGRDLTNWSMFSGIFGSRFEIWEAAIRMWWEFPLMGIGQGNFYRLSDIASFSKSHFLILNRGENAHNYFLQTLTETGLIGVTVFGLVLIAPYLEIKDRKILRPAFIAMMGLFLGNVFSHSFLVRENLIIFTIICALIWANTTCAKNSNTKIVAGNFKNIFLYRNFSLVLLALTFSLLEIKSSFGKFPFHYGVNCWRNSPVSDDGWISGFYETDITNLVSKDQIILYSDLRRSIGNQQEVVISILKNGEVKYRTTLYLKGSGEGEPLVVQLPVDQLSEGGDSNLALQVKAENCFTPRNLGINLDGRLLGLRVAGIKSGS
jgi:O-antigen ligase